MFEYDAEKVMSVEGLWL